IFGRTNRSFLNHLLFSSLFPHTKDNVRREVRKMAKNTNWQAMLEEWFGKLPALPKGGREFIVMVTPWLTLIGGVLAVLGGIAVFGLSAVFSPLMILGSGAGTAGHSFLSSIVLLVAGVLMLLAFPGLKAKKMRGWDLVFWSILVWFVS